MSAESTLIDLVKFWGPLSIGWLVAGYMIYFIMQRIHGHYEKVRTGLKLTEDFKPRRMNHTVVVLVGIYHQAFGRGANDPAVYLDTAEVAARGRNRFDVLFASRTVCPAGIAR